MKNNANQDFLLFDVGLRLRSDQSDIIDFIKCYTDISKIDIEIPDPKIHVHLYFNKQIPLDNTYHKISRNLWLRDSHIIISKIDNFPILGLKVWIENDKLFIDAFLQEKKINPLKSLLNLFRDYNSNQIPKLLALVYYLLYFPYMYYFERFRDIYLLHAGAIEYKKKGIILSGLGGVGKSTLALGALSINGCNFIADNLIFHDTKKIYPLPEPIALNPNSTIIQTQINKFLISKDIKSSHDRIFYRIKSEILSLEAVPKYLFWLQWGKENKIVPLKKERCLNHLLNINLIANELREYYIMAAALDFIHPQSSFQKKYYDNLSHFTSNVDCYILRIKPGDDIKTIYNETISKVII